MGALRVRKPVYAGQFYPSSAASIRRTIGTFVGKDTDKLEAVACLVPHAGYIYSGQVAAETLSGINIRERIILLGPNHTGSGAPFSIMARGRWQTPLGEVEIDSGLADKILSRSRHLQDDYLAHAEEHSLEVVLPLLQYFKSGFKIVPITVASDDISALKDVGEEIALAIKELGAEAQTLIVTSSDLTHYETQAQAEAKDRKAIEAILDLNEDKLIESIRQFKITMCGRAPAIIMLKAAKLLNARSARLIKYRTSAEATGDKTSVVGYAGITVY